MTFFKLTEKSYCAVCAEGNKTYLNTAGQVEEHIPIHSNAMLVCIQILAPKIYQFPPLCCTGGQWADILERFRRSAVIARCLEHNKQKVLCLSWIWICWWLVQLLGKSYWCVMLDMSMTSHIIGVSRENMISFIHVSCLHSESLQSLSVMILVSHVTADCEETSLGSGEQTDSLVDLFAGSLLLPSGDLYRVVSINVR